MLIYKLRTFVNKDEKYLKWIRQQPSIIPCPRKSFIIAHHVGCSGGKYGNDYVGVPVPFIMHISKFHDIPEIETYHYYRIDIFEIICNLLAKYIYESYGKVLSKGKDEDHIFYLIEQIRELKGV